ncbi:MAG: hypothetical protein HN704_04435 [Bacteroidetes bacterium]|jgi:gliding motility-associated-like protein|nr:hypothetical protein [Bacteroidota bacterium]MBT6685959.1 hypothetical protein [Bacteroidota bacterium]MBT7144441.1 hypothetical protein [Bacteroidota bacterium]MBT7490840.1 hypothetical protein [Bacteroidota bacterium]
MEDITENRFEKTIRDKFENYSPEAPNRVLDKIKATRGIKPKAGFVSKYRFLILGISAIAIVSSMFFYSNFSEENKITNSRPLKNQNVAVENRIYEPNIKSTISKKPDTEKSPTQTSENQKKTKLLKTSAGENEIICGQDFQLNAILTNKNSKAIWTCSSKNIQFNSDKYKNANSDPNAKIQANSYGVYQFIWTENLNEKSVSAKVEIEFVEIPEVQKIESQEICGLEITLNSQGKSGFWKFPENIVAQNHTSTKTKFSSAEFGKKEIIWTETNSACSTENPVIIDFLDIPNSEFIIVEKIKCFGGIAKILIKDPKIRNYSWDFDDGILTGNRLSDIFKDTISLFWENSNEHTISLTTKNQNGCSSSNSKKLTEPPKLKADFEISNYEKTIPTIVYFRNKSTINGEAISGNWKINYEWKFGDGNYSNNKNPENLYLNAGKYIVKLKISDNAGCTDSLEISEIIAGNGKIAEVSNIFTPNGDGKNDVFSVKTNSISGFRCIILNKRSEKIYEWADTNKGWDGNIYDGTPASNGMYYYIISGKDLNDNPIEIPGIVYLVRE